jgi:hypothetical protein
MFLLFILMGLQMLDYTAVKISQETLLFPDVVVAIAGILLSGASHARSRDP